MWALATGLPERGGELEGRPDHAYEDGTRLPGGLRAGDHVLLWPAPGGACVLFTGDALNGQVELALARETQGNIPWTTKRCARRSCPGSRRTPF